MIQKVFVLWATGQVGTELVHQIIRDDGADKNPNPTHIIGMANSKTMLVSDKHINEMIGKSRDDTKQKVKDILDNRGQSYTSMTEILEELKKMGHSGEVIIVDVTAAKGEEITKFHIDAVSPQYNFKVVTANKNPVSLGKQSDFDKLTATHRKYDYNTAVMAGAGALDFIIRSKDTHDDVTSIEGCFSGTLGYIASELEKWEKPFSEIVAEAKALGYTEPNPWDDLNGLDVARKLLILARTAGYSVEMSDITVEGFIDNKYGSVPEKEFLEAIKAEDETMAMRYKQAKENGNTLKYVATMKIEEGKPVLSVGLREVEKTSAIGSLSGTNNIAKVETKTYQWARARTLSAPGAGLDTTALSIRASIARMLPDGLPRFNS